MGRASIDQEALICSCQVTWREYMDLENVDNSQVVDKGAIPIQEEAISLSSGADPNSQMKGPSEVGSQPQLIIPESGVAEETGLNERDLSAERNERVEEKNGQRVAPDGGESRKKRVIKKRLEEKEEPRKSSPM